MSTEKQFREVVDSYLKCFVDQLEKSGQLRLCEDQFVGYVTVENGQVVSGPKTAEKTCAGSKKKLVDFADRTPLNEWKRDDATSLPGVRPQIIIQTLESPHKEEYLPRGEPPRPAADHAQGKTGWGLSKLYDRAYPMHRHKLDDGKYALVLINAIRYQCSLGVHTETHRTELFKHCWAEFGRDSYMDRIRAVYKTGDIVINSCTSDGGMRYMVQGALEEALKEALKEALPGAIILKLQHPCRWQYIANMINKGKSLRFEWD